MNRFGETPDKGYVDVSRMLEEMKKDLPPNLGPAPETANLSGKEAILASLARAADDHKFLARLAEDPAKAMIGYNLTAEEGAALASGDLRRIESWVGKLDDRMCTWIYCRLAQEKW